MTARDPLAETIAAHHVDRRKSGYGTVYCNCGHRTDVIENPGSHTAHVAEKVRERLAVVELPGEPERLNNVRLIRWRTSSNWENTVLFWPGEGIYIQDCEDEITPDQARHLAAALLAAAKAAEEAGE